MELYHNDENVMIEIRPKNWYENPSQCITINLEAFDVYQLIEELEIYANHCREKTKSLDKK
jgi:hypothetical protein